MRFAVLFVALSACAGSPEGEDSDTDGGDDPGFASLVEGRIYALDLLAAEWVHPVGFSDLIQTYLEAQPLVGVPSGGSEPLLSGSIPESDPPEQNPCVATDGASSSLDEDGTFAFAGDLPFVIDESGTVAVYDGVLEGEFAADGSAIVSATWTGQLDARDFDSDSPTAEELCSIVWPGMGEDCVPCKSDGEPLCVPFEVTGIPGAEVAGADALAPVLEADVASDPACAP